MPGKEGGPSSQIADLKDQQAALGHEIAALKASVNHDLEAEGKRLAELMADGIRSAREAAEEAAADVVERLAETAAEGVVDRLMAQVVKDCDALRQANLLLTRRIDDLEAAAETSPAPVSPKKGGDSADVADLAARCEGIQAEVKRLAAQLDEAMATAQKADMQLAQAWELQHSQLTDDIHNSLQEHSSQLASVAGEVEAMNESVQQTAYAMKNVHTRSVTWVIRGFKEKLAATLKTEARSMRSQEFMICSQPPMLMELVAAPGAGAPMPIPPIPGMSEGGPLPLPGSMSVALWAPYGGHVVFRLTAGEGPSAVSRRFEYSFDKVDGLDHTGRCCFLVQNFCAFDTVWQHRENTLSLTLDVLDMRFPVPPEDAPEVPGTPQEFVDAQDNPVPNDAMSFMRSITTEALTIERFKSELTTLRNRSVRRVEWKVQGVQRLLDLLSIGESVESPFFSAAGLEKMQFHFYPRGTDRDGSVSASSQPCALYVSAPARTTLKAVLTVGSNSRSFEHSYRRKGDVGGRNKFCSLEHAVDAEDCITLHMDIQQVDVDMPEQSFSLALREAGSGKEGKIAESRPMKMMSGLKGSMKMHRSDPDKTEEVFRCMSLPALNTQKNFLPQVGPRPGRSH